MEQHFVCTNCKGTADAPKACDTEHCEKKGENLVVCTCDDGQHTSAEAE